MVSVAQIGRKPLVWFVSTIAWVLLLASFLATVALLSVDNLKHVGNSASSIVKQLSQNQNDINSLIDEFRKNADPKTVAEIDKNRTKIEATIASIGGSKEFQDALTATLNKISEAILNGSSSVQVDFTKLATLVADELNRASNSIVITKKELAKLKPQTLDLGKQSKVVYNVRNRITEVMLSWLLWLILLGVLFLLKRWKVLRTAGWQLFSVGTIFLAIRFSAPVITNRMLTNSSLPIYQRDLVPRVLDALTGSLVEVSIAALAIGLVLIVLEHALGKRLSSKSGQISPSVVA